MYIPRVQNNISIQNNEPVYKLILFYKCDDMSTWSAAQNQNTYSSQILTNVDILEKIGQFFWWTDLALVAKCAYVIFSLSEFCLAL